MSFEVGRKFWIAATAVIVVVTLFVVGRNSLHAVKIKRQINAMTREKEYYRTKIEQDSTLLERSVRRLSGGIRPRELPHAAARRTCLYYQGISFSPGDGSRSQGNAAAFGPLFFFVMACRGTKCLPRDEMPVERRYAGRCEGRPVCSAAVFLLWPAEGGNVVEGRNVG